MKQPDEKLRALNTQPTTPGPREEVFCTKVGTTHPEEMYIVGGHMDGHGWGEAANDDGSGTALVMELARVFSAPDVKTERSIRFALWNNEETGSHGGARLRRAARRRCRARRTRAGSGKYPEPKWLGMIQHDMMMFDHGMPLPDGTMRKEQRAEADVNIEFQSTSKMAAESQKLAWVLEAANEKYATDYPAAVGPHMTNTDSGPFMDIVPAISLRENERGVADRRRLGSAVAPADRCLRHLHRQGLPPRPERGADDARRRRGTGGRDAGEMTRWRIACAAAILLTSAAYATHFHNDFHFDDVHTIQNNVFVRSLGNIPLFFTSPATFSALPANQSYRPLVTTTLALDYWLGGGLDPFMFHVTNFTLFLVQCVLLLALYRQLMDRARSGREEPLAGAAGGDVVRAASRERRDGQLHHRALGNPLDARRRDRAAAVHSRRRGQALSPLSHPRRAGRPRQGTGGDVRTAAVSLCRVVRARAVASRAARGRATWPRCCASPGRHSWSAPRPSRSACGWRRHTRPAVPLAGSTC